MLHTHSKRIDQSKWLVPITVAVQIGTALDWGLVASSRSSETVSYFFEPGTISA